MKATYDPEHGLLYIYFGHPDAQKSPSVKETKEVYGGEAYLDIGWDGEPVGIEFLNIPNIVYFES